MGIPSALTIIACVNVVFLLLACDLPTAVSLPFLCTTDDDCPKITHFCSKDVTSRPMCEACSQDVCRPKDGWERVCKKFCPDYWIQEILKITSTETIINKAALVPTLTQPSAQRENSNAQSITHHRGFLPVVMVGLAITVLPMVILLAVFAHRGGCPPKRQTGLRDEQAALNPTPNEPPAGGMPPNRLTYEKLTHPTEATEDNESATSHSDSSTATHDQEETSKMGELCV